MQKIEQEGLVYHHPYIVPVQPGGWMRIRWASRNRNGTLTRGRVDQLDQVLPKTGDVPRSPLPENGSLLPSAGKISTQKSTLIRSPVPSASVFSVVDPLPASPADGGVDVEDR